MNTDDLVCSYFDDWLERVCVSALEIIGNTTSRDERNSQLAILMSDRNYLMGMQAVIGIQGKTDIQKGMNIMIDASHGWYMMAFLHCLDQDYGVNRKDSLRVA